MEGYTLKSYKKATAVLTAINQPQANVDIYISGIYGSDYVSDLLSPEERDSIRRIVEERMMIIAQEGQG